MTALGHGMKCLATRDRIGIKVRLLSQRHNAIPLAFAGIIVRCRVENGAVVPDRQVILVPSEAYLQIMILSYQLQEVLLQNLAFSRCDIINPTSRNLMTRSEKTLPTCDWIGADYRTE